MIHDLPILDELRLKFGTHAARIEDTRDGVPTISTDKASVLPLLRFLKQEAAQPYPMLFDITAIDERNRTTRPMDASNEFTTVYQLFSFDRNQDLRVKVPLASDDLALPSVHRSGRRPIGTSVRRGTCSGSGSTDIPIFVDC
jgi:NADH-quinone oxidoreductase subunit C/D